MSRAHYSSEHFAGVRCRFAVQNCGARQSEVRRPATRNYAGHHRYSAPQSEEPPGRCTAVPLPARRTGTTRLDSAEFDSRPGWKEMRADAYSRSDRYWLRLGTRYRSLERHFVAPAVPTVTERHRTGGIRHDFRSPVASRFLRHGFAAPRWGLHRSARLPLLRTAGLRHRLLPRSADSLAH